MLLSKLSDQKQDHPPKFLSLSPRRPNPVHPKSGLQLGSASCSCMMLLITCGWGSNQQDKRKDRKSMDHHPKPKTAYCDCICQLLRAEFCRKLAFPGHSPAVRYSEVILPVGCARSALGCSSAKRSRSPLVGSFTRSALGNALVSTNGPVPG